MNHSSLIIPASRSGSVGIIHLIEENSDIEWIARNATAGPYTVVLPFSMFARKTLSQLRDTNNVNGVLLVKNISEPRPNAYSPEDTCPNRYSGYKKCNDESPWNPAGSSLLMEDWPFPMFYTDVRFSSYAIRTLSCLQVYRSLLIAESNADRSHKALLLETQCARSGDSGIQVTVRAGNEVVYVCCDQL